MKLSDPKKFNETLLQLNDFFFFEIKTYVTYSPVERTPGTGRRPGMSVGIDWTSQALHCAEPEPEHSETGSTERLTKTNKTIM